MFSILKHSRPPDVTGPETDFKQNRTADGRHCIEDRQKEKFFNNKKRNINCTPPHGKY